MNMMKLSSLKSIILLAMLILFSACTTRQEFNIQLDKSGNADIHIELSQALSDYIADLNTFFDDELDVLDTDSIIESLEAQGITVDEADRVSDSELQLSVAYPDFTRLIEDEDFIEIADVNGRTRLKMHVDAQTVESLLSLSPLKDSMLAETLLPPEGTAMNILEYTEYLIWALEEYEDPDVLALVLEESVVAIQLTVPGAILSFQGFSVEGRTAVAELSLVALLSGNVDQDFELVYK